MQIKRATNADLDAINDLVERAGLLNEDVAPHVHNFLVGIKDDEVVGAVGLELFGTSGLLRSLAVAPPFRGKGLAARLCRELCDDARERGIRHLYLLTIDADGYFLKHGFKKIDRSEAPSEIQSTEQYSKLCPDTAVLMYRDLTEDGRHAD
jgi:amino-acid N-acetyltransferase